MPRLTPRRMCAAESPVPRVRCTFCARSKACAGFSAPDRGWTIEDGAFVLDPLSATSSSVCTTNHLHGIVSRRATRRVHRRQEHDHQRTDERLDVLAGVLAH